MASDIRPVFALPAADLIRERLATAIRNRTPLAADTETNAYRLVHGEGDGLPHLFIDRFADGAVIHLRDPAWMNDDAARAIGAALSAAGLSWLRMMLDIGRKERAERDAEAELRWESIARREGLGETPKRVVAKESGRSFSIRPLEPFAPGLFLDMRAPRAALAERWNDRRVLNLFSYTCGFGVMLTRGNQVTHVDSSKRALLWGQENYELGGLNPARDRFVHGDVFGFMAEAAESGDRWDAIILDPPVHSQGKSGRARTFTLRRDFGWLLEKALDLLAKDGELFVSTNYADLSHDAFRSLVVGVSRDWDYWLEKQWSAAIDFPGPQGKPHLKTALLRPRVAGTSPGRKNHTLSRREKGFEEPSATMEPRPNARPPKPAKPVFKPAPKPSGKHSAAAAAAAAEAPGKAWGKEAPKGRPAKSDSRRAGTHETGRPDPNAAPKQSVQRSKPTNRPPTNRTKKRSR
jgi:23S rRNA (cytosine1962-C5)-methyltransferase